MNAIRVALAGAGVALIVLGLVALASSIGAPDSGASCAGLAPTCGLDEGLARAAASAARVVGATALSLAALALWLAFRSRR